jgi:hypothetical protein
MPGQILPRPECTVGFPRLGLREVHQGIDSDAHGDARPILAAKRLRLSMAVSDRYDDGSRRGQVNSESILASSPIPRVRHPDH